ncbi:MAG: DUF4395 family protein [Myxococcaceae bacterium]|nr:DUF4395 family protein [Myxococcaceae bacterium]MCA3015225.1 DUF4395 family protein [Myxococcaceae bacterium]
MTTATTFSATPIDNRDLAIIDARAPRFNQAIVAVGSAVAVATGAWPILLVLGTQLAVSVLLGRQYCLPCLFYFKVVQPRLGPGPVEDSRAPKFANTLGALFLLSASAAYAGGLTSVGFGLGAMVAGLATLASTTGLCVGCEVYRVIAKVRGVRGGAIARVDLEALGGDKADGVVLFTHPLCSDCQTLGLALEAKGERVVRVDVSKRRDLAKKYGVAVVPLAVRVDPAGRVTGRVG